MIPFWLVLSEFSSRFTFADLRRLAPRGSVIITIDLPPQAADRLTLAPDHLLGTRWQTPNRSTLGRPHPASRPEHFDHLARQPFTTTERLEVRQLDHTPLATLRNQHTRHDDAT
jgi:hypothetical protein